MNAKEKQAWSWGIGIVVVLIILAVGIYPFLKKSPQGTQTAAAESGQNQSGNQGSPVQQYSSGASAEQSKNTIRDSATGQEVLVPTSDPEQSGNPPENSQTIYDSSTGQEVPVPASDPGN